VRTNKCCPGCGTLLIIGSDRVDDAELTAFKSFWIWAPLAEDWMVVRDWDEEKALWAGQFESYSKSSGYTAGEVPDAHLAAKKWIH